MRTATAVAAMAATSAATAGPQRAFAIGRRRDADPIRIGVIGCGGRGIGAARDALAASENVSLVALGDLFPDKLAKARSQFEKLAGENQKFAADYQVAEERCFTGFDAIDQVLAADIDLAILATPPAFRSAHLTKAIAAGKHVFMEKPVAVDAVGALAVIAASDLARERGLAIVSGTQRRHDPRYIETIRRIHDGSIGDVLAGQVYWNQGGLWSFPRQPEWSDVEWQLRNWLYFTWLSGDHIVEQHVHNLDVANWVMGSLPVKALGFGGRQVRTDPAYGHIFDHFAVEYEYPGGQRITSMCRQQDGTASKVGEFFIGTRGTSNGYDRIQGRREWRHPELKDMNPYVEEHRDLVASIRAGRPLNEGRRIAESTLTAIMGRESAYTGQSVTMDELLASNLAIMPPEPIGFDPLPVPAVPMPGETTLDRNFDQGW
ncbi:MAG TPA: Gfo/Idh/MocA family oxidoreductase [Gemmatimonadales bacterium]|nr:Gfo/Idh/MocA family oxidoreductase [Gemmatimonadales bacterium]